MDIYGTSGNDTLNGTSSADFIYGLAGNDSINGGYGIDTIRGGDGDDTIVALPEESFLYGDAGNDTFKVYGGSFFNSFYGGTGVNTISLEASGSDYVFNSVQVQYLEDIDYIINTQLSKQAVVYVRGTAYLADITYIQDVQTIKGSGGDDTIYAAPFKKLGQALTGATVTAEGGNDRVVGTQYGDDLSGMDGADTLEGGSGSDTLQGGSGIDVLIAGVGDDKLSSGKSSDVLVFGSADGNDQINDFTDGRDTLDLSATSASNISDLAISSNGQNVLVRIDSTEITIKNIAISSIDSSDFIF